MTTDIFDAPITQPEQKRGRERPRKQKVAPALVEVAPAPAEVAPAPAEVAPAPAPTFEELLGTQEKPAYRLVKANTVGPWWFASLGNKKAALMRIDEYYDYVEMLKHIDYEWVDADGVPLKTQDMLDAEAAVGTRINFVVPRRKR